MPNGQEAIVLNTQERLVSTDHNRLQAFKDRDLAELLRHLVDVGVGTDDLDAAALYQPQTTLGTPLLGEVASGLLVQPQIGSLNVLVSAGVAYVINPDSPANPDASIFEYVSDPGVQTLGALTIGTNSSGQTRIDVVECQPQIAVLETDSRDVFDPATDLFNATTVTKAVAARMTYRVRAGTPGSGYPGHAAGWLPLCVASVPTATTSNDTIDFWDVRPLMSDRPLNSYGLSSPRASGRGPINASALATTGGSGTWEASPAAGLPARRLGGRLRRGTPGTDADTINLTDVANQEGTGSSFTGTAPWHLYLLTPLSLPRWSRYTDATSGARKPRSPRGIPVVSTIAPNANGVPSSAITVPTSTGLGTTTTAGVCIASGWSISGTQTGFYSDEQGGQMLVGAGVGGNPRGFESAGTYTSTEARFTFTPGTHWPAHAKAVLVCGNVSLTPGSDALVNLLVYAPGGVATQLFQQLIAEVPAGGDIYGWRFWIELPSAYPSSSAAASQTFSLILATTTTVFAGSGHMDVVAWRF